MNFLSVFVYLGVHLNKIDYPFWLCVQIQDLIL